jgi:hypothetical protein
MRSPKIPQGAEIARTYERYDRYVDAFFQGRYHLLVVIGRPGLTKSHGFEQRLGPTSHLIKGWTAPLQAYIETYRHRNKLLVFDDAEVLWKRAGGRILLRSLCEHKPHKLVQWASTAPQLRRACVPQSFLTSSKVAIIANRFVFGEAEEYEAFVDRGHLLYFDPSPVEVHNRVGDWFWDQDVYDYIGDRLHLLNAISVRLYTKAWERKQAGGDWKELIAEAYCRDGTIRFVQALETDPTCPTVEDKVRKFIDYTQRSRATYFNIKRELLESNQLQAFEKLEPPRRQLQGTPPLEPDLEEEVARAKEEDEPPDDHQAEGPKDADSLPSWCQSSDNPQDYHNFADYQADWWKRPRPPEDDEEPRRQPEAPRSDSILDRLRREMQEAIDREAYERAAELRDQIRRIENGNGQA